MQFTGMIVQFVGMAVLIFWAIVGARDGLGVVIATLGRAGLYLGTAVAITCILTGVSLQLRGSQRLRSRLRQSDGMLCPRCHYDLAGLSDEGQCPECAEPYSKDRLATAWRDR